MNTFPGWSRRAVWMLCIHAVCLLVACRVAAAAAKATHEVGMEWVSFHYEEPGAALMSEDGSMFGMFASYTYDFDRMMMVSVATSYDWGNVGYDGWLMDFNTGNRLSPVQLDTPNSIFNLRVVGGRRFKPTKSSLLITPVTGIGFRYLVNDLPGIGGYTREQTYWYLPIGVEGAGTFRGAWRYVVRFEYDYFLWGSNISGGDKFSQDSGYGVHVSTGISCPLSETGAMSFMIEPYFRYWNISDSTVTAEGWYEPANSCSEYGIKCSILF